MNRNVKRHIISFDVGSYYGTGSRGKIMKKVLIVDDASVVRLLIKKALKQGDFEIVGEAANGIEAFAKYKELKPDIVTMDITMPEADGIQATKDIIAFDENAKIVMLSGIDQKEMLWKAIKAGAASYIVKPFENDRILSTLNEVTGSK